MNRVLVIAEAGVNHNGDLRLARSLIQAAARAGADIVKFQTFRTENIVVQSAPKADYQKATTGTFESQFDMLRKLELDERAHEDLIADCAAHRIQFLSTAFDLASVGLLAKLKLPYWKIPSGEITNLPYLRAIGSLRARIFLSSGMADLGEIEDALNALEEAGTRHEDITVLHCTTEYPAPWGEVSLTAMLSIGNAFHVPIGYSDHTSGIEVAVAAAALGATVIEKHLTLSRQLPGPDHRASIEPSEFSLMVESIRHIEQALGDGVKRPAPSELMNRKVVRKSIVAAKTIRKGEQFTADNLAVKRPGTGISPMQWDVVVGRLADRDYAVDEIIK